MAIATRSPWFSISTEMTVRQATIADLDALVPLFDAYRQFYRKPSDLNLARQFLLERFQNNESIIFIAIAENGDALGFHAVVSQFFVRVCGSDSRTERFVCGAAGPQGRRCAVAAAGCGGIWQSCRRSSFDVVDGSYEQGGTGTR